MKAIVQHLRSLCLLSIAIALMSCLATPAIAGGVNVRVNRFTPFNLRPDVAIRGHGAANVQVNVNGFGGNVVRVNGFRVNAFHPNVFVVPQPQAFFVGPQYAVPVNNFGVSTFGFQTFGGCCR